MNVCLVTCFYGRAEKIERLLRVFVNQDYEGTLHLLLFNNSPYEQILGDIQLPQNKTITLVNQFKDSETGKEYTNVGAIFRDALKYVPDDTDVINFFDSDDVFLPTHVSEGVRGMQKAKKVGCVAYKPYWSYFLYGDKCTLEHNTLEPSIFVEIQLVKWKGFNPTSATYHQKWESYLKQNDLILMDRDGVPTLLYDWSKDHNTFKISGSGDDGEENLKKHREFEKDCGDGVLDVAPEYVVEQFYEKVNKVKKHETKYS